MTQKELNYLEDIYNHEKLITDVLYNDMENNLENNYIDMFDKQVDYHDKNMKKIEKLLGGNYE